MKVKGEIERVKENRLNKKGELERKKERKG